MMDMSKMMHGDGSEKPGKGALAILIASKKKDADDGGSKWQDLAAELKDALKSDDDSALADFLENFASMRE